MNLTDDLCHMALADAALRAYERGDDALGDRLKNAARPPPGVEPVTGDAPHASLPAAGTSWLRAMWNATVTVLGS